MTGRHRPNRKYRVRDPKRKRRALLLRDGPTCWYCGLELGEDRTFEHLVPLSHGGKSNLANLVLAHGGCNKEVENLSLRKKVRLREVIRRGDAATVVEARSLAL